MVEAEQPISEARILDSIPELSSFQFWVENTFQTILIGWLIGSAGNGFFRQLYRF